MLAMHNAQQRSASNAKQKSIVRCVTVAVRDNLLQSRALLNEGSKGISR